MRIRLWIGCLLVLATLAAGCEWKGWNKKSTAEEAEPMVPRTEMRRLEDQIEDLEAQLDQQILDNKKLTETKEQLAADIEELRWVNDEQSRAIRDLGTVIDERDQQREVSEQLRLDKMRLQSKIKELEAKNANLTQQLETAQELFESSPDVAPALPDEPAIETPVETPDELPEVPDAPEAPEAPDAPETPDVPDAPEKPERPSVTS